MNSAALPSLYDLLPTVQVDGAVLKHIRTIFYSSTKDHEHLANVSIYHAGDSKIRISSLLPTTPQPGVGRSSDDNKASPDNSVSLDTPLLSSLTSKPPPVRRPTHSASSLLKLFPPSATCQTSPPLQIHVTLPNVRLSLSDETDLHSSTVGLTSNSLYILLTTGQTSEKAGLLLSSQPKRLSRKSGETLEPASFTASGKIAGVWVQGNHSKVSTLALHALAAAWWTRRNHRVNHKPVVMNSSGAWYERRIWLVRFLTNNGITVQSGMISVRDDAGTHYIASVIDSNNEAQFKTTITEEAGHQPSTIGKNWQTGWVMAPTPREAREAEIRRRNRSKSSGVASESVQESDLQSLHRVRLSTSTLEENENIGEKAMEFRSRSVDSTDNEAVVDSGILNMRMKIPSFQRCNKDLPLRSKRISKSTDGVFRNLVSNAPVEQQNEQRSSLIDRRRAPHSFNDSESEHGELDDSFMENLCKKYLQGSYTEETMRHLHNSPSTSSSRNEEIDSIEGVSHR